jgi:hypothetical protein
MHGLIFETSICYRQDQPGNQTAFDRSRERIRTQHRNSVFGPSLIGVLQTVFPDICEKRRVARAPEVGITHSHFLRANEALRLALFRKFPRV